MAHPVTHRKIFLADDDAISMNVLAKALQGTGFSPVVRQSGKEILQLLLDCHEPCVAILDWMMPDMEGPEICRRVRAAKATPYTYIILLTSKSKAEDLIEGLGAGADDYITKPFDLKELQARLSTAFRILDLETLVAKKRYKEAARELALAAAHEINSPLTAVLWALNLLEVEIRRDASKDALLIRTSQIDTAARRIEHIVKKMSHLEDATSTTYLGDHKMVNLRDDTQPSSSAKKKMPPRKKKGKT